MFLLYATFDRAVLCFGRRKYCFRYVQMIPCYLDHLDYITNVICQS